MGRKFKTSSWYYLVLLVVLTQSGCATTRFLAQAAKGQLSLLNRAQPIEKFLNDPDFPSVKKHKLQVVQRAKKLATELGLNVGSQYRDYVPWDGPYLVYNLTASKKDQFKPKKWSFPIVGTFPYLGFFDKDLALETQNDLKGEMDTYLRGVTAYSTLGWFPDPVPSTLMNYRDLNLVELIVHELVHATVFIKGDVPFNERLATYFAGEAVKIYIEERKGKDSEALKKWKNGHGYSKEIYALFGQVRKDLDVIYQDKNLSQLQKLSKKSVILESFKKKLYAFIDRTGYYKQLKTREVNNAMILAFQTYGRDLSQFRKFHANCGSGREGLIQFIKGIKKIHRKKHQNQKAKPDDLLQEAINSKSC